MQSQTSNYNEKQLKFKQLNQEDSNTYREE